jgi:dTDP-4-amino-4,6-dideoxygalactose transaminase
VRAATEPIPFNRPTIAPRQLDYVAESFASDKISGDGAFSHRVTDHLADDLGTDRILLTPSCTDALEMCALLLDIGPGDEVIVPSFTFVSTANAFAMFGARPVFADIDPIRFDIDPDHVASLVTERTRAVVAVHYGGAAAPIDRLTAICDEHGLAFVEDAAHALLGRHGGQPLGRFGALSTFSFHETKNISCGEGGALVVNDEGLWDRARVLREKGTDRARFMEGLVDKYTWIDKGSSYLLADPLAAILLAQLEFSSEIQQRRTAAWSTYAAELAAWAKENEITLPTPAPDGDVDPAHLFAILLPTPEARRRFLEHTRSRGVTTVFHYLPLHRSPYMTGQADNGALAGDDCPVTDDVSARLARLPVFSDVRPDEVPRVLEAVLSFEA